MSRRFRFVLAVVWLISLWAAAAIGQTPRVTTPEPSLSEKVFSGKDLGFRIDGYEGTVPIGKFVVRVNDRWVEVEPKFEPQIRTLR